MDPTPIDDRVDLDATRMATLREALSGRHMLQDVVRWALSEGFTLLGVVVQDEFTHDILISWTDDLVLVFDAT